MKKLLSALLIASFLADPARAAVLYANSSPLWTTCSPSVFQEQTLATPALQMLRCTLQGVLPKRKIVLEARRLIQVRGNTYEVWHQEVRPRQGPSEHTLEIIQDGMTIGELFFYIDLQAFPPQAYIYDYFSPQIFVDPHYRHLGIATRLMEMAFDVARRNGAKTVDAIDATSDGQPFFEHLGFQEQPAQAGLSIHRLALSTLLAYSLLSGTSWAGPAGGTAGELPVDSLGLLPFFYAFATIAPLTFGHFWWMWRRHTQTENTRRTSSPPGSPASVFRVLMEKKRATPRTISEKLGISWWTVDRDLSPMVKRGLVQRTGPAKSPDSTYELTPTAQIVAKELFHALDTHSVVNVGFLGLPGRARRARWTAKEWGLIEPILQEIMQWASQPRNGLNLQLVWPVKTISEINPNAVYRNYHIEALPSSSLVENLLRSRRREYAVRAVVYQGVPRLLLGIGDQKKTASDELLIPVLSAKSEIQQRVSIHNHPDTPKISYGGAPLLRVSMPCPSHQDFRADALDAEQYHEANQSYVYLPATRRLIAYGTNRALRSKRGFIELRVSKDNHVNKQHIPGKPHISSASWALGNTSPWLTRFHRAVRDPEVTEVEMADASGRWMRWTRRVTLASVLEGAGVVQSPTSDIQSFVHAFRRPTLPPQEIVKNPSKYVPGYETKRYQEEPAATYFNECLELALKNCSLSEPEKSALRRRFHDLLAYLGTDEFSALLIREADEIIYAFIRHLLEVPQPGAPIKHEAEEALVPSELDWLSRELISVGLDIQAVGKKAMELALGGNRAGSRWYHDAALNGGAEVWREKVQALHHPINPYSVDDRDLLVQDLIGPPKEVLYLLDNVVEHFHDLPFLRWILERGHTLTIVAKAHEADNDVTVEDMRRLLARPDVQAFFGEHLHKITVISGGSATRGTDLRRSSPEFISAWQRADVIIAKGEGSWTGLRTPAGLTKDVYFFVHPKSARESPGIPEGTVIIEKVLHGESSPTPKGSPPGSEPSTRFNLGDGTDDLLTFVLPNPEGLHSIPTIEVWDGQSPLETLLHDAHGRQVIVLYGIPDDTGAIKNLGRPGARDPSPTLRAIFDDLKDTPAFSNIKIVYIGHVKPASVDPTRHPVIRPGEFPGDPYRDNVMENYQHVIDMVTHIRGINPDVAFAVVGGDDGYAYADFYPFTGLTAFTVLANHTMARTLRPQLTRGKGDPRLPGANSGTFAMLKLTRPHPDSHLQRHHVWFFGLDRWTQYFDSRIEWLRRQAVPVSHLMRVEKLQRWSKRGIWKTFIRQTLGDIAKHVDHLHASLSILAIDVSEAPGRSAVRNKRGWLSEQNRGVSGEDAEAYAYAAGRAGASVFDILEVAPLLEPKGADHPTSKLAAKLLWAFFVGWESRSHARVLRHAA